MRVGIFTNLNKDIEGRATIALVNFLKGKNIEVIVSDQLKSLNMQVKFFTKKKLAELSDVVVVFGGDGTILRIAKECAVYEAKIFAVNLGTLGFLTEVENVELSNIFNEIINGKYFIDKRALLSATHNGITYCALNDVVITRSYITKMLRSEVQVDGVLVDTYASDGIIVATPTGSTAYSLSSGGPILSPDVEGIIIAPICPHSLHSRHFVVSDKNTITVKLLRAEPSAYLNIDGVDVAKMFDDDIVIIKKASSSVEFIRLTKYNFFDKLQEKMRTWC